MRKDATEFRLRFLRWKSGELVYDKGRTIPHYEGGSDGNILDGGNLGEIVVKPPKGWESDIFHMKQMFPDKTLRHNIYKDVHPGSKPGTIEDESLGYNGPLRRLYETWKYGGRPDINYSLPRRLMYISTGGRDYRDQILTYPDGKQTILLSNPTVSATISELSHAVQHNNLLLSGEHLKRKGAVDHDYDANAYNTLGVDEYYAHLLIEPKLAQYIYGLPSNSNKNIEDVSQSINVSKKNLDKFGFEEGRLFDKNEMSNLTDILYGTDEELSKKELVKRYNQNAETRGLSIPHLKDGTDGYDGNEEVSDNTRVVNTRVNVADRGKVGPSLFELMLARHNAELIGPAPNISLYEKDLNRLRAETKQWAQLKKAAEEATDEFMLGLLDPRYAAAGVAVGQAMKGFGSLLNAGKNLYKSYKVSKAIDKAVDGGIINRRVINPVKYSDVGGSYDIKILPQDAIDHYRKLGFDGLTDDTQHAPFFKDYIGMSPSEYKEFFKEIAKSLSESERQNFIQREFGGLLNDAQETIDDLKRARTQGLDPRLYEARDAMVELYDSPEYRKRWPAYSPRPDELIGNLRGVSGSVLNTHIVKTDDRFGIKGVRASGSYSPALRRIQVLDLPKPGFFDTATHEFSHASDLGEDIEDLIYDRLVPKKSLSETNARYYNQRTEKRARVMSALADMKRLGYNINSYNDILDYLLFENGFGNHNVKSLFDNYDFKIQDLLDIFAKGKSLVPPVIGVELYNKFTNDKR